MRFLIITLIVALTTAICIASEVKKIESPSIDKIQTTSGLKGQISFFDNSDWLQFSAKNQKSLDKAAEYFYKIKNDPKAVLYVVDEMIVGATSPKYGKYGSIPQSGSQAQKKPLTAKVVGCDFQQGNLYCSVKVGGKSYYINGESSAADLTILNDNPGKKVKIVGSIDGDTIKADSLSLTK
jgi:hypothetical protein